MLGRSGRSGRSTPTESAESTDLNPPTHLDSEAQTMTSWPSHTWKLFGRAVPRSEVVYLCQVVVIFVIIITCILNLSLTNGNKEMWVSFLGYSLGALLPPPKIKKSLINK